MTDLNDQLRAYGRQIEQGLESAASEPDDRAQPADLARRRIRRSGRNSWLLIAATTALVALSASLLFPSADLKENPMNRKATGIALGLCLLAGCTAEGEPGTATMSPTTASPTAAAGASSSDDLFVGTGMIEPGTYQVRRFGTPIEVTMPKFWTRYGSFALEGDGGSFVAFFDISEVPTDACRGSETKTPIGPTVDNLVTALTSQQNSTTTAPQARDLDGHPGVYLEIAQPAGLNVQDCEYQSAIGWYDRVGNEVPTVPPDGSNAVWAVDLGDGQRVVITWGAYQPLTDAQLANVQSVIDSITVR